MKKLLPFALSGTLMGGCALFESSPQVNGIEKELYIMSHPVGVQYIDREAKVTYNDARGNGTLDILCHHRYNGCIYIFGSNPEQLDITFDPIDRIITRDSDEARKLQSDFEAVRMEYENGLKKVE